MSPRERTRPPRLRAGDVVAVVAPAGPVPAGLLDTGLAQLRSWGLEVRLGEHLRRTELGYLAGTDVERASDLRRAWCDPEVRAVFCARGGYGSMRVLDLLDWEELAGAAPKAFVGSSDITALHELVGDRLGLVTVFGPMVATKAFAEDEPAREHLRRTLFDPASVTALSGDATGSLVPGRARGTTWGGNLSLLAGTLGAPGTPLPPDGALALLEDITEDPYQLDRFLTQLLRAGWFDRVAGIALGSWVECGPPEQVRATMTDRLGGLGVPVLWELGFGHCPAALTVPLGAVAELDTEGRRLVVQRPALA
ncbi:S66 peptidase family protein [Saccharopolyspora sp. CA-218241]|uniref:S66 peptidase family protein n=1 Tax=Saccharopolyspora sp. CA-218241 TaxID=3240027 RepID=UPI003D960433